MKNILNFDDFLNESLQSHKDIIFLTNLFINKIITAYLEKYSKTLEDAKIVYGEIEFWNHYSFMDFLPKTNIKYEEISYSKKLSKETKDCIKKSNGIYVLFEPSKKTTLGSFDNNRIIRLYVNLKDESIISRSKRQRIIEEPSSANIDVFLREFRSTLIHELQHYIDRWRSDSKYLDKNHTKAMVKMSSEYNYEDYYKLSHEISARYTQALSEINNRNIFTDFLSDFKDKFVGWNLMTPEIKARLTKRLYQYYTSINKNKNKLSAEKIDIVLDKIKSKYDVKISFDGYVFDIYDADIAKKDYKSIINDMVKLSDIYRYDIEIYPYPEIKEYLKSVGFKENRGRNIRYDLSWSCWYYVSKRN